MMFCKRLEKTQLPYFPLGSKSVQNKLDCKNVLQIHGTSGKAFYLVLYITDKYNVHQIILGEDFKVMSLNGPNLRQHKECSMEHWQCLLADI